MQDQIDQLKRLVEVQGSRGNCDYSEYMWGMYNGMELALAVMEDREPVYKNKPKVFSVDKNKIEARQKSLREKASSWLHIGWAKR